MTGYTKDTFKVEVYQIKNVQDTTYAFRDFSATTFNKADYEKRAVVNFNFESPEPVLSDMDTVALLEDVFSSFNSVSYKNRINFRGHSMSVSDVVVIEGESVYYCNSFDWVNITDTWKGK